MRQNAFTVRKTGLPGYTPGQDQDALRKMCSPSCIACALGVWVPYSTTSLISSLVKNLYELRTEAGLSQRKLAELVGTTASVICRLEDADYEGHSLSMLNRIAAAVGKRVQITFVPLEGEQAA